jgi:hypothetical protein
VPRATATFTETAGTGGRITSVTGTIIREPGDDTVSSLQQDLPFVGRGTLNRSYTQDFTVSTPTDVSWGISASGIDDDGRQFFTPMVVVGVVSPTQQVPTGGTRLELWGGVSLDVYLGCFTCSQFDAESVHNQFGRYGSRFSPTSIWNQFSPYGSPFSPTSACNEFATSPPILLNPANRTFVELTLNRFRPNAVGDVNVLSWLQFTVCQR